MYDNCLLQSPDGKYIACGAIDGIVNIFDIATGKLIHTLEGKFECVILQDTTISLVLLQDLLVWLNLWDDNFMNNGIEFRFNQSFTEKIEFNKQ